MNRVKTQVDSCFVSMSLHPCFEGKKKRYCGFCLNETVQNTAAISNGGRWETRTLDLIRVKDAF